MIGRSLRCAVLMASFSVAAHAGNVHEQIQEKVEALAAGNLSEIGGARIVAGEFLKPLYELRAYEPIWFETGRERDLLTQLTAGLAQGFRPPDFHLSELYELRDAALAGGAEEIAAYDILASEAAARLVHHTRLGKVNPEDLFVEWNFGRKDFGSDPALMFQSYIDGAGFNALMEHVQVDNVSYDRLVGALGDYRLIMSEGGWPEIPEGEILKPGMTDDRLTTLRTRLAIEGYFTGPVYDPTSLEPEVYGGDLEASVKEFQTRHGLEADGVMGRRTFQALNRTAEDRVNQIRMSLERLRWLATGLPRDYVVVNIAGAETTLIRDGEPVWRTRSITGSEYRKTPVFRDNIQYMEINPTWTVPNSIFRKDKLARIREDPAYLNRNGYSVRAQNGNFVPVSAVNWNAKNPGVTLVQAPGPNNALGLIKFMFPNKYSVYLHDTNNHSLFERAERNLSSGCVRLEAPFEFADLLMRGDPDWSTEKMQAILKSGETTRVELPNPMPVLLTYWTAWVDGNVVQFREDIYDRDDKALEALNAPLL